MRTPPSRREAATRARELAARQFGVPPGARDDFGVADPSDPFSLLDADVEDDADHEEFGDVPAAGVVGEWSRRLADRTPPGWRAVRVRVGRRAVAGAVLAGLLVAAGLGVAAWRTWPGPVPQQGDALPARTAPVASPTVPGATPSVTTSTASVVVHVAGHVLRPGVVTLSAGSRVADALTAVGGPAADADLDALNLARVLQDGEQVLVPAPGQPGTVAAAPATGSATGSAGAPGAPVDLNSATAADLDALPGVGEVLAGRIVAWREENGRFTSVDDLGEVQGIGPKVLEGLRDLVSV